MTVNNHTTNTWSALEVIKLKELHLAGFTAEIISQKLQRTKQSVISKLNDLKIHRSLRKLPVPRGPDHNKKLKATVRTSLPSYGISTTPFTLAESELREHFSERNGVKFYKGKAISGMLIWHSIVRDANKKRKADGKNQIDDFEGWIV